MRPAVPEDGEFLVSTFLTSLREPIALARGSWDERRERSQFERQLQLAHTRVVQLAEHQVGFVTVVPRGGEVELHTLCLVPKYQSQGLGSYITRAVVESSLAQGYAVVMSVLRANPRAKALYERLGFSVVGESEHHFHLRYHSSGSIASGG